MIQLKPRPSFATAAAIVAKREIRTRFLSKSFIISTALTLGILLALMVLMPRMESFLGGDAEKVAVTAQTQALVAELPGYETVSVPDEAAAREAVAAEEVAVAVIPASTSPTGVKILTAGIPSQNLLLSLSQMPEVEIIATTENAPSEVVSYILSLGFGMVWMMAGITFGMSIAQSVVEEKQTRIVEILLASVSARALLTGKIIGNSIAALVQVSLIAGVSLLGLNMNGTAFAVGDLTRPILWFVPLFIVGFVMVASMYAAAAALVSRQEDLANVQQPIMWLIMIPYFLVVILNGNSFAMQVMSYVPFTAPVAVPIREFTGEAAAWEPFASLGVLIATTAVIIAVAAKIYDRGLLRTGRALKWSEALRASD